MLSFHFKTLRILAFWVRAKPVRKFQFVFWPVITNDLKQHLCNSEKCHKQSDTPPNHYRFFVDGMIIYFCHDIGLDFLSPLPVSKGCRYSSLGGDFFTKRHEIISFSNQLYSMGKAGLLER